MLKKNMKTKHVPTVHVANHPSIWKTLQFTLHATLESETEAAGVKLIQTLRYT